MSNAFSQNLSELRRRRGLSQRTAASDLHISQALLSHYENGAREPGLNFVTRACEYYGVSADYLLGRADDPGAGKTLGDGSFESAYEVLQSTLNESGNPVMTDAVVRHLTAAVYKLLCGITEPGGDRRFAALNAELALTELTLMTEAALIGKQPSIPAEISIKISSIISAFSENNRR